MPDNLPDTEQHNAATLAAHAKKDATMEYVSADFFREVKTEDEAKHPATTLTCGIKMVEWFDI